MVWHLFGVHLPLNSREENNPNPLGNLTRRKVLGNSHVDLANKLTTDFDASFQDLITSAAWEKVWSRPHLTLRERSMITLALLAAMGHEEEFAMHLKATANTGATKEDISEVLLHVAIYAGVPAANSVIKVAKKIYEEMEGGS